MNVQLMMLINKANKLGNQSAAIKESMLWAETGGTINISEIKLAVNISEFPELTDELYNNYQKDILHEKIKKLIDYAVDIDVLNLTEKLTERERETHLHTINDMLNHRALI